MSRNLGPLWARAPEAAPVNVRPNAPRATSAPRRVMALATICLFLPATTRTQTNARDQLRRDETQPMRGASPLQNEMSRGPAPSAPIPQTPGQGPPRDLAGRAPPGPGQPPSGNRWRSPAAARWRQFLAGP